MLQNCNLKCNDKINYGKKSNFIKSTESNSPTGDSGEKGLPPIGDSFMYMGNSGNNHRDNVFCSFERADVIQNTNITFCYNRFSVAGSNKAMGGFRIQFFWKIIYGVRDTIYLNMIDIVILQLIGPYLV